MLFFISIFRYVDMIGLTDPSDNIDFVMRQLAIKLNAKTSGTSYANLYSSKLANLPNLRYENTTRRQQNVTFAIWLT